MIRHLLTIAAFLSLSSPAATPVFGRYVGVLEHDSLGREQLAKLDFVLSRASGDEMDLKAVLTLHFGDFGSAEYVSYHYDRVRFNLLTGALVFDDENQALSLFVKTFSGGILEGEVTSIWSGASIGKLRLASESIAQPTRPLIESLWGEYSGSCGDERAKLQIYTFRSTEDLAHQAQPFAGYNVVANLSTLCQDGICINFGFTRGSYNFFARKEQLSLVGKNRTYQCSVLGNRLECLTHDTFQPGEADLRRCNFEKTSTSGTAPRQLGPTVQKPFFEERESDLTKPGVLQPGEYAGFVFHEGLGVYQRADLKLNVFQAEDSAKISAHARLYFGDFDSSELIPYRFAEKAYPHPLIGASGLVLSRIDANMDAIIQITKVEGDVLRGIWYSAIYGRVGPFELKKGGALPLPPEARTMLPLSGLYRGSKNLFPSYKDGQWLIKLAIVPGIKPPTASENPFFPNFLRGSMILTPVTGNLTINDGSYDFYTGRFGFSKTSVEASKSGGDSEHFWIGRQASREELDLFHVPSPIIGAPPVHSAERFRIEKGGE